LSKGITDADLKLNSCQLFSSTKDTLVRWAMISENASNNDADRRTEHSIHVNWFWRNRVEYFQYFAAVTGDRPYSWQTRTAMKKTGRVQRRESI